VQTARVQHHPQQQARHLGPRGGAETKASRFVNVQARETIPTEPAIWLSAAKLEEAHGNEKFVPTIVKRALKSLLANNVVINRDSWLKEAESAEKGGSNYTCTAIVQTTVG